MCATQGRLELLLDEISGFRLKFAFTTRKDAGTHENRYFRFLVKLLIQHQLLHLWALSVGTSNPYVCVCVCMPRGVCGHARVCLCMHVCTRATSGSVFGQTLSSPLTSDHTKRCSWLDPGLLGGHGQGPDLRSSQNSASYSTST